MSEPQNHTVEISEEAPTQDAVAQPVLSRMCKVRVLAEAGIFKNGVQHDQDSEAVITLAAAERFAEAGEVEILGDPDE